MPTFYGGTEEDGGRVELGVRALDRARDPVRRGTGDGGAGGRGALDRGVHGAGRRGAPAPGGDAAARRPPGVRARAAAGAAGLLAGPPDGAGRLTLPPCGGGGRRPEGGTAPRRPMHGRAAGDEAMNGDGRRGVGRSTSPGGAGGCASGPRAGTWPAASSP